MRFTHAIALAALLPASLAAGTATAGEPLHLTPPLYREHVRMAGQMRPASDLTTTPQPVAASKPVEPRRTIEVVAEATSAR